MNTKHQVLNRRINLFIYLTKAKHVQMQKITKKQVIQKFTSLKYHNQGMIERQGMRAV